MIRNKTGVVTKKDKLPLICSLRGRQVEVFRRAHLKAKKIEGEGKILSIDDWKQLLKDSWIQVKEEAKKISCEVNKTSEKGSNESDADIIHGDDKSEREKSLQVLGTGSEQIESKVSEKNKG